MSSIARACPACGSVCEWDARFCPQCGRPLESGAKPARLYGAVSPGAAFVLGCVLLAAALLAFFAGSVIAAIVLAAIAAAAFVLFYDTGTRHPDSGVVRRIFATAHHIRGWVVFARESGSAWAHAIRDVVRLRRESRSLRRERDHAVRSLGDAAYREDEPAVTALRGRLREIDAALTEREKARAETLARAHRHVQKEHAAAQVTKRFPVDELTSGGEANG